MHLGLTTTATQRWKYKPAASALVEPVSRLGASPGLVTLEPGLAPKRLIFKVEIRLNRQPPQQVNRPTAPR